MVQNIVVIYEYDGKQMTWFNHRWLKKMPIGFKLWTPLIIIKKT